jgi:hypothetical protein
MLLDMYYTHWVYTVSLPAAAHAVSHFRKDVSTMHKTMYSLSLLFASIGECFGVRTRKVPDVAVFYERTTTMHRFPFSHPRR